MVDQVEVEVVHHVTKSLRMGIPNWTQVRSTKAWLKHAISSGSLITMPLPQPIWTQGEDVGDLEVELLPEA